jgi:hypothetical protein
MIDLARIDRESDKAREEWSLEGRGSLQWLAQVVVVVVVSGCPETPTAGEKEAVSSQSRNPHASRSDRYLIYRTYL